MDLADAHGSTPLRHAAQHGHAEVARALLQRGAEPDRTNDHCHSPLWLAAYTGDADMARLLLDHGAAVDRPDRDGVTPLWVACRGAHEAVAQLLAARGAWVDRPLAEAGEGVTPRWVAARRLCWDTSRWGGRFATTAVAVEREGAEGQLVLGRRPRG